MKVYVIKKRKQFSHRWTNLEGKTIERSTGLTNRRDAERAAIVLEEQLANGIVDNSTWPEFRKEYTDHHLKALSLKHKRQFDSSANRFETICEPYALKDIGKRDFDHFCDCLRDDNLAEATIAAYMRQLKAALRWAFDRKLIGEMPKMQIKTQSKKKGRAITGEEFDRILAKINIQFQLEQQEPWRRAIRGLWLSGMRLGEFMKLSINPLAGISINYLAKNPVYEVKAGASKRGIEEPLPVAWDFVEFLRTLNLPSELSGPIFEFPRQRGGMFRRIDSVSKRISKLGKLAGVKVAGNKFASAHDFRRSFGERWSKIVPMPVLRELMWHTDLKTTMTYYVGQNASEATRATMSAIKARNCDILHDAARKQPSEVIEPTD